MSEEEARQAWTYYWNRGNVAETFGGKEDLARNPKYYLEEEPITALIPKCSILVDFGCGVGRYTQLVKPKCNTYVGVDYSEKMLKQARLNNANLENVHFIQSDLETFEFKAHFGDVITDATCDVGLLIAIIRHLPTEKGLAVLRNVKKQCKLLLFTSFIVPEEEPLPTVVKGLPGNQIIDNPYHLSDIKQALDVETLDAIPLGDRDPTKGERFLFQVGKYTPIAETAVEKQSTGKPLNRMSTVRRTIHGS